MMAGDAFGISTHSSLCFFTSLFLCVPSGATYFSYAQVYAYAFSMIAGLVNIPLMVEGVFDILSARLLLSFIAISLRGYSVSALFVV